MQSRRTSRDRAFTLVELLVVIGIIAVLIAILLPVLAGARRAALDAACRSNMRQVANVLFIYAAENKGLFPPNIESVIPPPPPGHPKSHYWFDADRIGKYFRGHRVARYFGGGAPLYPNSVVGGAMGCPGDERGSRSYAMNWWASCRVTNTHRPNFQWVVTAPDFPTAGKCFNAGAKGSSKLILLFESFTWYPDGHGGFMTEPFRGKAAVTNSLGAPITPYFDPGWHFLGSRYWETFQWNLSSFPGARYAPCQGTFDYARHRRGAERRERYVVSVGRTNIAFADGHVENLSADDLADRRTGRSKFAALWTVLDPQVERATYYP